MKLLRFSLALAALALLVFTGSSLLPAPEAEAGPNCRCMGPIQTIIVTGDSTDDCWWAEMDAHQKANGLCGVDGFCEFETSPVTGNCSPDGPTYWEFDLEVTYQCNVCF